MRIVRPCGTHRWTSSGARSSPMRPPPLPVSATIAHLALVRGDDGRDHVGRIARCRYREQHVALGAERPHLFGEHLLERIVVADRRQQRRVGGKRYRRAAPAARARSGRQARRQSAARRKPSRRCRMPGSCRRRTGTRSSTPRRARSARPSLPPRRASAARCRRNGRECARRDRSLRPNSSRVRALSFDIDDVATPIDARRVEALHQDRIEAAGGLAARPAEIVARRRDQPRPLRRRDALGGTAEARRACAAALRRTRASSRPWRSGRSRRIASGNCGRRSSGPGASGSQPRAPRRAGRPERRGRSGRRFERDELAVAVDGELPFANELASRRKRHVAGCAVELETRRRPVLERCRDAKRVEAERVEAGERRAVEIAARQGR